MTKTYLAGLQASTQTSYANNGKTTMLGRAYQKTINSQQVIGPPLTQFIDVQTLAGFAPAFTAFSPSTNRLYVLGPISATPTVALFNFNNSTGVYSYVGKVLLSLANAAATTHTTRGFEVYESGGLIYPMISTTGTVAINGGTFVGWGLSASDFTIGGTTIFPASGSNQKAMYFMQDSAALGNAHVATTSWGLSVPQGSTGYVFTITSASATAGATYTNNGQTFTVASTISSATTLVMSSSTGAPLSSGTLTLATGTGSATITFSAASPVNTKVWQWNGTLALPVLYSWDMANTPTVAGTILNGVSAQTTLYAGTSPSAFFTMGASQNGYSLTNGEPVVLMNGTGNVPTAFTAWAAGTAQVAATNVYFVRDLQLVSGNYYFNLATTTAGAAVTPTSSTSSFTMMRAFGTNSSLFSLKTGTLPAFALGAILQNQSVGYAKPTSAPANTALNGQDCLYMMTSTGLYMGKISDLTSLGTTWASMTFAGVNITGTGTDYTALTNSQGVYSGWNLGNAIDKFVYITNSSTFVVKPYQTSTISTVFGGINTTYYEGANPITVQAGVSVAGSIHTRGGWLFISSITAGQRGIIFIDLYSDAMFGAASVISPVLSVPVGSTFKYIDALEQLFDSTDSLNFFVRSAPTSGDALFSSATGGWTSISVAKDLSSTAIGPYFQLMATYQIATLSANTPAQINDFLYSVISTSETSDNWAGSVDNTTQNGASPAYTAFRLETAYATSVPTMYFRAYDDSGNLVASANTSANPTLFQYSTNNGTSWTALGTVPNTVNTTELRYNWATPPGVRVTASLRES